MAKVSAVKILDSEYSLEHEVSIEAFDQIGKALLKRQTYYVTARLFDYVSLCYVIPFCKRTYTVKKSK